MDKQDLVTGEIVPEKLEGYQVSLFKRQESINKQIVGGKLLQWEESKELTFIQNPPRGARNLEVARTAHARMVRLKDGGYSIRMRFVSQEKSVGFKLIAELRELSQKAAEDTKQLEAKAVAENKQTKSTSKPKVSRGQNK